MFCRQQGREIIVTVKNRLNLHQLVILASQLGSGARPQPLIRPLV